MALHVIHRACELPEQAGRSLSQWDCTELARQLVLDGTVAAISPQTIQRILARCRLKPWRSHLWLHPRTPRDAAFVQCVHDLAELYSRPLAPWELVLCLDEMTSLQPRHRRAPTRPAREAGEAIEDVLEAALRLQRRGNPQAADRASPGWRRRRSPGGMATGWQRG